MKKAMSYINLKFLFFLCLFMCITYSASGNKNPNIEQIVCTEEINVCDIKISDFLLYLSKEANVEIIAENSIKSKKIDFFSEKNSSLNKILNIFCKSNNLQFEKGNGYIFVFAKTSLQEGRGNVSGRIFSFNYKKSLSGAKVTLLDDCSSSCYSDKNGYFKFYNIPYGTYFIRVEKNGYKIEGEMLEINKNSNQIKIFMEKDSKQLKNKLENNTGDDFIIEKVKFSDVEAINENIFEPGLKKGIKFAKSKEKGIIYLSGERKKVLKIKEHLENLDSHNKQVRITAQILDVSENIFEELGFSWLYGKHSNNNQENEITAGVLKKSSIKGISSLFSSTFNFVKNFNNDNEFLEMTFEALQGTQDLTITAMPSIVTTSGKIGVFKITEERIIGEEKTKNNDNGETTYTPIFREAGIILKVTPEIMKDNSIILGINLETSDFKMHDYIKGNTNSNYGGSKVSRNLNTTIKLNDGDTVFIGGLKKSIVQSSKSSIPYISTIPVIGNLFKNTSQKNEVTDLYIRLKINMITDSNFQKNNTKGF